MGQEVRATNTWSIGPHNALGEVDMAEREGYPALPDIQAESYSGLEYGQRDTHILLGGSSGKEN